MARQDLVERLAEARLAGHIIDLDEIEGHVDDAQALQVAVLEALEARGHSVGAWKLGLTSGHAYDMMGPGVRPFGSILSCRVLQSGAHFRPQTRAPTFIEPELCLELGTDLAGPMPSRDACRAAVSAVKCAFEINQSRVRMPGRNRLFVADGLANWGLVLGGGLKPDKAPTRPVVEMLRNDEHIQSSDPDMRMDDPFTSLATLCDRLHRYGRGLSAGQHVITGAFFRQPLDVPGEYKAIFQGLGDVTFNVELTSG